MLKNIVALVAVMVSTMALKNDSVKLTIYDFNQNSHKLTFEYEIQNDSDSSIWICQAVDSKIPLQYEIKLDEKEKSVRIRQASFEVPANIFLEEPIWGKYIKIESGKSFRGKVKLELPLQETNPIKLKSSKSEHTSEYIAKQLIFDIGIIPQDLSKLKNNALRDDSSENIAYVSGFWVEENPESICTRIVKNTAIPCQVR